MPVLSGSMAGDGSDLEPCSEALGSTGYTCLLCPMPAAQPDRHQPARHAPDKPGAQKMVSPKSVSPHLGGKILGLGIRERSGRGSLLVSM